MISGRPLFSYVLLPSANFYSIDLEMTSLKGPAEMGGAEHVRPDWTDTTQQRYLNMREVTYI